MPDEAGGGTVAWTNPWGQYAFLEDIEAREDAGTPGFLQAIRAALAVSLKEAMTVEAMQRREHEIVGAAMDRLLAIPGVHLLAPTVRVEFSRSALAFWRAQRTSANYLKECAASS